ncbi:hypothetical protein TNCV_4073441 [Trichonephila clavipes]|uniref:Uncharacterized protein n=1 Tax=Trichonephila clavipes TaxID=2585209 RepID=A0A8X7BFR4_TRICX|nr:hypothetical protein TNCV_4073441 [Trichonephila clavipes]
MLCEYHCRPGVLHGNSVPSGECRLPKGDNVIRAELSGIVTCPRDILVNFKSCLDLRITRNYSNRTFVAPTGKPTILPYHQGHLKAWRPRDSPAVGTLFLNKSMIRIILMDKNIVLLHILREKKGTSNCMSTGKSGQTALLCDGRCSCLSLGLKP